MVGNKGMREKEKKNELCLPGGARTFGDPRLRGGSERTKDR